MADELDEESAEIRDVYAHAGLTLYLSQCVEHGLVNLLMLADMLSLREKVRKTKVKPTAEQIDEYLAIVDDATERHFKRTMGNLLQKLYEQKIDFPDGLEEVLSEALERRNRIAHRFFRERALELGNHRGRLIALEELNEMESIFNRADVHLGEVCRKLHTKLGLRAEKLAEIQRAYEDAARAGGITEKELQVRIGTRR